MIITHDRASNLKSQKIPLACVGNFNGISVREYTQMEKLTQKKLKELLHYDPETGMFTWKVNKGTARAGSPAGYSNLRNYIGKGYLAHRLAWLYIEGFFPTNIHVDHIDRNPSNNKWSNLRLVSNQCNLRNTGNFAHNKSGVKGVCWHKEGKKWTSQIKINGKRQYLGLFSDFNDAVEARLAAEESLSWSSCDIKSPAAEHMENINTNLGNA